MTEHKGIRDLGNGRYWLRVQPINPSTGKRVSREKTVEATNYRDAERQRAVFETEVIEQLKGNLARYEPKDRTATLNDYIDFWLADPRHTRRAHVNKSAASDIKTFIRPFLGAVLLTALSKAHLLAWYGQIEALRIPATKPGQQPQPYARQTLAKAWRYLRSILSAAYGDGWLPNKLIDTDSKRYSPVGAPAKPREALTADEAGRFIEAMATEPLDWRVMTWVFIGTGMRFGEVSALTWADVDFERERFTVSKSQVAGDVNLPKTGRIRKPGAHPFVFAMLRQWFLETPHGNPDDLVFPSTKIDPDTKKPTYRRAAAFFKFAQRVAKRAGIDRKIGSHSFRRTANTGLLDQGIDPNVVRAIIGHSTEQMTEHYRTIGADAKTAAATAYLGALLGDKLN